MALAERPEAASDDLRYETMPLSELRPGQKAILKAIEAPTILAHRLMACGFGARHGNGSRAHRCFRRPDRSAGSWFRLALRKRDAQFLKVAVGKEKMP